jgi:hypothetical protein
MQTRPLEEPITLAGFDAHVHGVAVAIDRDRHVDAGFAQWNRGDFGSVRYLLLAMLSTSRIIPCCTLESPMRE